MASDSDDDKLPTQGRFTRFRKLAGLSAQLGADVLKSGARKLVGQEADLMSLSAAEKLVSTLGELKGAAMKFGQVVSMDPELFSPEVRQVIARLQNEAPPMPYAQVAGVIRADLGDAPEKVFREFSQTPLAAASLGQVHRAVLHDGREVAVKVQYPGIEQTLVGDMENLGLVVKTVSKASRLADGTAYFQEMRDEMLLETDYLREAALCTAFGRAVAGLPDLKVPEVIAERTTRRVLTLELLRGRTLKDWVVSQPSAEERYRVARQLILAIYGPLFTTGDIHADPHPGNFMVLEDGRLGVLDFGSIKRFSPAFVATNRRMFLHAVRLEPMNVLALCREVGFTCELPDAEGEALIQEIFAIAGRPMRQDFYDFSTCGIAREMRTLFTKNAPRMLKIRPPAEGVLFFRSTGGLIQNLRLIGAEGNFRRVYQEVAALL
ncbi:ABC1 kinase family protein [Archangium primigenium]|uniref:ABC1 kinase family protein n=1 Tax=[Archangium] primigenium TaxID=2792470 RepID=UPI001956D0CF|nr:AarF/ABC1/UbiB kinase family protein [Archangium primigenium]MBM7119366.1 AarF/ABC1/UbiB kinase family protein [Archangium primigenium]